MLATLTSYPSLYKVDSKNKIRKWKIWIEHDIDKSTIFVEHGEENGAKQVKKTVITKGKNIGKKNETNHITQSRSEAESKWNKQKDKLYVENIETQIKNGKEFRPMLAHKFSEHETKIKFPAYVSRKSDGLRCYIKLENDNTIVARSRNGKAYKAIDHITSSLKNFFYSNSSIVLDGELYLHGESFQLIVGAIKRDEPNELTSKIEFHVYDCYDELNSDWLFKDRLEFLKTLDYDHIRLVDSIEIKNKEEVNEYFEQFIKEGYEGLMIRNNSPYEQKRSYNLQKVKSFDDGEYEIVSYKIDKNGETVFICVTEEGKVFDCKPKGDHEYRKSLASDDNIGKWIKIEHFGFTNDNKPRFPIGLQILSNKDELH